MAVVVVAYNKNFAIAENGEIPWRLSEDFKHFKETTSGGSIIMGRTTYESLPKRPLPMRFNIVLSRDKDYDAPGACVSRTLENAIELARDINFGQEIFIVGGQDVYNSAFELGVVDKVIASEVDNDCIGDRFFPNLSECGWDKKLMKEHEGFRVFEFVHP